MSISSKVLRISLGEVGFCGGVSRADSLLQEIREKQEGDIYILGDLIHNRSYKEQLEKERIFSFSSLEEARDKVVVIRTHGIPPEEENILRSTAKKVYDLTCPLVKVIHEKVEQFSQEGYVVFIVGDPNHAETKGIMGYSRGKIFAIQTEQDLENVDFQSLKGEKVVLLSQSTFGQDAFLHLCSLIQDKVPHILVENTICYAPTQRQEDISTLIHENDAVIVVGGVHSSNTIKLFEKAKRESKNGKVYHIETSQDLDKINFSGIRSVGIASGTSTPDFIIQELVQKLENLDL